MNKTLLTATLIVSTKSITAFSGDLKYVQMPHGDITGMAGRVVETASVNSSVAIEVNRELIPALIIPIREKVQMSLDQDRLRDNSNILFLK